MGRPRLSQALLFLLAVINVACAQEQKVASIGDLRLESGETIRECRVGYRTFGKLNADKSNVIVAPTWFSGTSAGMVTYVGPGKLLDSSKYYVVVVDALGNGVSSSPSNSTAQPRMAFPRFTIRDMVNSQHALLTRELRLNHVRAVVGLSMGGMQAFQWAFSYPGYMDKVVPLVSSPRLAAYDLVLWRTMQQAIENDPAWNRGNYREQPANATVAGLGLLNLTTPEAVNKQTQRESLDNFLAEAKRQTAKFDMNDRLRQLQAMIAHDVYAPFGGSVERAAAAVKPKFLIVVSTKDHMVTPGPAIEFAHATHSGLLMLDATDCGHTATSCELPKVQAAINEFLNK
ncbi:MAG: alpha/beta fold hydrolase [Terriglobales bacterium]